MPPHATIADARRLATAAHEGQVDKNGEPYFEHVQRVARKAYLFGATAARIAYLHDVLEDTDLTADDLRARNFSPEVIEAVELLTRGEEPYLEYLQRLTAHPIARMVKLCDLEDNNDPKRLSRLPAETRRRLEEKYRVAYRTLLS